MEPSYGPFFKMPTINVELDLDCSQSMSMILYAFPEEKLKSPLLYGKMHYCPENDFIITKPIFY